MVPLPSSQDVHSQGEVIACLEKGLVREAEDQAGAHVIREECKKAIMRVAELSSDDFHLDRYLYFSCRDDRERFCENVRILYSRAQRILLFNYFKLISNTLECHILETLSNVLFSRSTFFKIFYILFKKNKNKKKTAKFVLFVS